MSHPDHLFISQRHYLLCIYFVLATGLIVGCGTTQQTAEPPPVEPTPAEPVQPTKPQAQPPIINPQEIPKTPREMRAVWIASVANIDWPSAPGLPVAQQKAELRAMMDRVQQLNMNAIILQVRPSADALYDSPYEPWSEYLTGKQGRPPKPYYDPLRFAIQEAHQRGLELHAWFNPFRAYHFTAKNGFAPSHIKNRKPQLVKKYGRYYWLDPGQQEAREYSLKVILDVARRYNIDGVHLDDYFYPYAELDAHGSRIPFPDTRSYNDYVKKYGSITKSDWRRQNINRFVKALHDSLRKIRPYLRFGISPFGIWRPGHPAQIKGFDAYANIYADARKWLREGWVDYLSPQLYWAVDKPGQSFPVLLKWWQKQNILHRHMWPGLYTSRVGNEWKPQEISRQIQLTREQPGATGNIHFSMQALMKNVNNIDGQLLTHEYAQPALVPATYWLSTTPPKQPDATLEYINNHVVITLDTKQQQKPWLWVLKTKYGDKWSIHIYPGWKQSQSLPVKTLSGKFGGAVVTVVDRLSNESTPQMLLPVMERIETAK